jgi:hypothetical protein
MVRHTEPSQELHECRDRIHQEANQHLYQYAHDMEVELYWHGSQGKWYVLIHHPDLHMQQR